MTFFSIRFAIILYLGIGMILMIYWFDKENGEDDDTEDNTSGMCLLLQMLFWPIKCLSIMINILKDR